MSKRAFTLIETIVTIVIVGIVALSFPLILLQTNNNLLLATQQEAILAAKTYIGTISSYPWDGNTIYYGDRAVALETNSSEAGHSADSEFNRVTDTNLRLGSVDGAGRRRFANDTIYPTSSAFVGGAGGAGGGFGMAAGAMPEDIDDFDNYTRTLNVVASDMDYIFSLDLTPTISYVSDDSDYTNQILDFTFGTGSTGITNIKMIAVHVKDDDDNVNITLRTYSANIGEFSLLDREKGSW
jgi:prepilin-type N-terminal cleavage/methylation domain-containing protein